MRATNSRAEILPPGIRRIDGGPHSGEGAVHPGRPGQDPDPDEDMQPLLLTVSEAARRLGIGRSLLYELMAHDELESIHVGRLRRIPADALVAYIDRQRDNVTSAAE